MTYSYKRAYKLCKDKQYSFESVDGCYRMDNLYRQVCCSVNISGHWVMIRYSELMSEIKWRKV